MMVFKEAIFLIIEFDMIISYILAGYFFGIKDIYSAIVSLILGCIAYYTYMYIVVFIARHNTDDLWYKKYLSKEFVDGVKELYGR